MRPDPAGPHIIKITRFNAGQVNFATVIPHLNGEQLRHNQQGQIDTLGRVPPIAMLNDIGISFVDSQHDTHAIKGIKAQIIENAGQKITDDPEISRVTRYRERDILGAVMHRQHSSSSTNMTSWPGYLKHMPKKI